MCQGFDPNDGPVGFCVPCDMELFYGDVLTWGNAAPHRYLKENEGHPTCPNCRLISIDDVVEMRTYEEDEDEG